MENLRNKRSIKIIEILLSHDEIVIKEISDKLDVSKRTIRKDLSSIETWMKSKFDLKLIKKPGVGIWIEKDAEKKSKLYRALEEYNNFKPRFSTDYRIRVIKKELFYSDNRITLESLADKLYVSKSTIYNDLKKVEKYMLEYNLNIKRDKTNGVYIDGNENNLRQAITDFLSSDSIMIKKLNESDFSYRSLKINSRIDKKNFIKLVQLFKGIDFIALESMLNDLENELGVFFTDEAYINLVAHIALSVKRLSKHSKIKMDKNQLNLLKRKKEFDIVKSIVQKYQARFNLVIPDDEIGYIMLHIIGAKLRDDTSIEDIDSITNYCDERIVNVSKEIISIASVNLGADLTKDSKLLSSLILHLRPAINRLEHNLKLRNPILNIIKKEYTEVFNAAWASSIVFENYLDAKINEEEIGYIALHLGAALERRSTQTKVVIVCSSGIGVSNLIASKLRKEFVGIEIKDIASIYSLSKMDLSDVDLIISAISKELIKQDIDVIEVSTLLTDADIKTISSRIDRIKDLKKMDLKKKLKYDEVVSPFFSKDLIFRNLDFNDHSSVIEFLGDKLVEKKFVKGGFIQSAIDREKITATAIGRAISVPHGEQKYVNKSQIAVGILKEPVKYGTESIKLVLLLAMKNEEAREFFKYFYDILVDDNVINKILESNSSRNILELLLRMKE